VVFNTHLHANYSANWGSYARIEEGLLRPLAEFVRAQPPDTLVIAAGDFNVPRHSSLYEELLVESSTVDPLADDAAERAQPRRIALCYAHPIDFALVRTPRLPDLRITSDLQLSELVSLSAKHTQFLSDHVGIELRVDWTRRGRSGRHNGVVKRHSPDLPLGTQEPLWRGPGRCSPHWPTPRRG
jgi:endonuclease/exonuclease/phosphatase family metal-dependent hydrolase